MSSIPVVPCCVPKCVTSQCVGAGVVATYHTSKEGGRATGSHTKKTGKVFGILLL